MPLFRRDKPQNRLEELLIAATRDPGQRPAFYRLLMQSQLHGVGRMMGDNADLGGGMHIAGEDTRFGSVTYDVGGEKVVPLFTSEKRVSEASPKGLSPDTVSVRMDARVLFEAFPKGTKFILNPASSFGKELGPDEVAALLDGTIFEPTPRVLIPKGTTVYLRVPPRAPEKVIRALTSYFQKSGCVERAHLAEVGIPDAGPPHLLVGIVRVESSRKTFEELSSELGPVALAALGREVIDFVELGTKAGSAIEEFMTRETHPFYRRSG